MASKSAPDKPCTDVKQRAGTFIAGLVETFTLMPVIATLITVALYIALYIVLPQFYLRLLATLGGAFLGFLCWLLLAKLAAPYTTADKVDAYNYNLLWTRWLRVQKWEENLERKVGSSPLSHMEETAFTEMSEYLEEARGLLCKTDGTDWISGKGYVTASRLLHRAEEALILIETMPEVISDGSRLEMTIVKSAISNQESYLCTLKRALDYLSPDRLQLFQEQNDKNVCHKSSQGSNRGSGVETTGLNTEEQVEKRTEVKTAIREVSYSLNEFQDDQLERLWHARNQLFRLIILTGLVLQILLDFAIVAGVALSALISATFFFLIGAAVGLFSRLYEQARVDSSIENIRLSVVRLMAAPLFSGLAAIGGVVVMQKVVVSSVTISFDLTLFNILVSAAFGLTPNLFFNAIQRQVDAMNKGK